MAGLGFAKALGAVVLTWAVPAMAQSPATSVEGTWSIGAGVVALQADEIAYLATGSPTELSHLYWSSTSPALTTSLKVKLPRGWTLAVDGSLAGAGMGQLIDYDWIDPPGGSYAADNWTDRSISPDTNLDWYLAGGVSLGHDFSVANNVTVNLNGGFKYTDVKWTASGGSYVYSSEDINGNRIGFRDQVGNLPPGRGITYRQQLPELIGGLDTSIAEGDWNFGLSAKAGLTFSASGHDNHWLRDLLFVDDLNVAPVVSVGASAERTLSGQLKVYAAANYEKVFVARANDTEIDTTGASSPAMFPDSSGGGLQTLTVTGGVKASF
jgi:outer membrane protease